MTSTRAWRASQNNSASPLRLEKCKWLSGIEYMIENKMGYWENRGYHPIGDPWKEEKRWK